MLKRTALTTSSINNVTHVDVRRWLACCGMTWNRPNLQHGVLQDPVTVMPYNKSLILLASSAQTRNDRTMTDGDRNTNEQ